MGFASPVSARAFCPVRPTTASPEIAATGREHVADVVVRVADDRVDVGLVLGEQRARVVVGVGVRGTG